MINLMIFQHFVFLSKKSLIGKLSSFPGEVLPRSTLDFR